MNRSTKKLMRLVPLLLMIDTEVQADSLRVLNWEEYLSPKVIELWQQETGVAIEEVYFDNDERRDAILADSVRHHIDVAVVDESVSRLFGVAEKLSPVDTVRVPNIKNISPFWQDRCGSYAVPYMWGTLGIAYRSDRVSEPPTSWGDLLEPSRKNYGHVGMLEDHMDMLAPALFYLGYPLNTDNSSQLKQAFEILKSQAPGVLTYEYAITFLQTDEQADQLNLVEVYSGDQQVLNELSGTDHWRYVIPKEGTVLWADCLAVISASDKKELAFKFIDFLNRPEIAALNSEDLYVATPNSAALPLLDKKVRNNKEIYVPDEIIAKSELYQVIDVNNLKLRQRISQSIKRIHETK